MGRRFSKKEVLAFFQERCDCNLGQGVPYAELYGHFQAVTRQQRWALRKHVNRLRETGFLVETELVDHHKPANAVTAKVQQWLSSDQLPFFDSQTPLRTHGKRMSYIEEYKRSKGDPYHPRYGQVLEEGFDPDLAGNHAKGYLPYDERCTLTVQVFTNGTVEIHTSFREERGKGFTIDEFDAFIDFIQAWGVAHGLDPINDFKLVGWDLNQDKNLVYDGPVLTIKAFMGIWLRVYSPEGAEDYSRWEQKVKKQATDNLKITHVKEALALTPVKTETVSDPSALKGITENEVSKILLETARDLHYADLAGSLNFKLAQMKRDIQSFASQGIQFTRDGKRMTETNHQIYEQIQQDIQGIQNNATGGLTPTMAGTMITQAASQISTVLDDFQTSFQQDHRSFEQALDNNQYSLQARLGTIQIQLNQKDREIAKQNKELAELKKKLEELEKRENNVPVAASPSPPAIVSHCNWSGGVGNKPPSPPAKKQPLPHLMPLEQKVHGILLNAGRELTVKDFYRLRSLSITKGSLKRRLLELIRKGVVYRNGDRYGVLA